MNLSYVTLNVTYLILTDIITESWKLHKNMEMNMLQTSTVIWYFQSANIVQIVKKN